METSEAHEVDQEVCKPSYEQLEEDLKKANEEIRRLKKELMAYKLDEQHLSENEEDVAYFTGLPEYAYLKNILGLVELYLPERRKLSKFQQLLMTLIKLRLNFHFTYLAKNFPV